ncbi:uncharacterized protein [Dermacentor albipictus]|uniref:uncharacterized protein n=1 Tax=Dermacentor albipictus TaxID=60249 RepID=UPI0038FC6F9A
MEETPLTSSSLSSRRCLGYESEEQAPRVSQHSLRKHGAQATEQQPDQARREQSSGSNTYSMVTAKSSGSLRLHKYDTEFFDEPREGLPLSHPLCPAGMERTPRISQHSLEGTGHDNGRSLHDVHGIYPFLRSDSAIHISKLSSGTQCSYAQGINGDSEQLSLQPQPDNTHDTIAHRPHWHDWFQAPYLWYAMMAIMMVLLITAVVAVFMDLHWAAQLPDEEELALADWQEPHHMEERVVPAVTPAQETDPSAARPKGHSSTLRTGKGHKARKAAKNAGSMGLVGGAKAAGAAQPMIDVDLATGTAEPDPNRASKITPTTHNEHDDTDVAEKPLPPILEPSSKKCGDALYTFCGMLYQLYHYRASSNECVFTVTENVRVCNRSPDRFATMDDCRRVCVVPGINDLVADRPKVCSTGPLFAPCTWRDVKPTWAIFDGVRCVRWPFPDGLCPATNNTAVFSSRQECAHRCLQVEEWGTSSPREPCPVGPGPAEVCRPEVLRFPYFSHHSANKCFEASEDFLARRRCLAAPTLFVNEQKCREKCMGNPPARR